MRTQFCFAPCPSDTVKKGQCSCANEAIQFIPKKFVGTVEDKNFGEIWEQLPNGNYSCKSRPNLILTLNQILSDYKNGYLTPAVQKDDTDDIYCIGQLEELKSKENEED